MRKVTRILLPLAAVLILAALALTGCGGKVRNGGQTQPGGQNPAAVLPTLNPTQAAEATLNPTGDSSQPTLAADDNQTLDQVDQDLNQIQNDLNHTDTVSDFK